MLSLSSLKNVAPLRLGSPSHCCSLQVAQPLDGGMGTSFPQDSQWPIRPVARHTHEIFLRPIDGHKLFIIIQLSSGPKIRQLIDALPIFPHQPHDVPRFDVPVDNAVLAEVVHPCHWAQGWKAAFVRGAGAFCIFVEM